MGHCHAQPRACSVAAVLALLVSIGVECHAAQQTSSVATELPVELAAGIAEPFGYGPVGTYSPDGAWFAYAVRSSSAALYVKKSDASRTMQLSELDASAWGPAWSPAGTLLAYFRQRDGQTTLIIEDVLTRHQQAIAGVAVAGDVPWFRPVWNHEGSRILVAALCGASPGPKRSGARHPDPAPKIFRSNRPGQHNSSPSEVGPWADCIVSVDVLTGNVRVVFRGSIDAYVLSPAAARLAVLERLPRADKNLLSVPQRLQVIDLETGRLQIISEAISVTYGKIGWSPDGEHLSWVSDYAPEIGAAYVASIAKRIVTRIAATPGDSFATGPYEGRIPLWDASSRLILLVGGGKLWLASPSGQVARRIQLNDDLQIEDVVGRADESAAWSQDNYRSVVVMVRNPKTYAEGLARVSLQTGEIERLYLDQVLINDLTFKPVVSPAGDQISYSWQRANKPPSIAQGDWELLAPSNLVPLNPYLDDYVFGTSKLIEWNSRSGDRLSGALLLPSGYVAGHRYPLIVDVYGDFPLSRHLNAFGCGHEMGVNLQLLATRGYAVLRPDTRLRVGSPVRDLIDGVTAGVDAAVSSGVADVNRVGVIGSSYGGYNVLSLISGSRRFSAAVAIAAQADLLSAVYGNPGKGGTTPAWAEQGQGKMGGTPWQFRERYIENSPVWNFDDVRTPLLLLHGDEDDAVPVWCSTLVFNALQRLGREVEYVQYPGEGHRIQGTENLRDFSMRIVDWFDEHLRGRNQTSDSTTDNQPTPLKIR